ncbi:MAG: hypothetical protein LBD49_03595 [Oscillospiraceae bacterium]|jgi:alpha-tubulin suppressor-like RCC1 family protein|nr:hypothetical protein [Oscillospiraceae bacterium]
MFAKRHNNKNKRLYAPAAFAAVFALALILSAGDARPADAADARAPEAALVSLGYRHGAAIASGGELFTWGGSDYGQLGDGKREDFLNPEETLYGAVSAASGGGHTLALRADGTLWAWGGNDRGQVGDGSREAWLDPVFIMDSVASVSAGEDFSLAVKTDGTLWAWGGNSYGQIGDGSREDRLSPVKIADGVASASGGGRHGLAVKTDGTLWAWGCNDGGQVGDGTRVTRLNPVRVMVGAVSASAGGESSLAIKTDGTLWSWGENASGQIGDGTRVTRLNPVKIMDSVAAAANGGSAVTGYASVADSEPSPSAVYIPYTTTEGHGLALKTDGTLWSWGYNGYGQLGDGSRVARLSPARVLSDVKEISAGSGTSAAVKTDGTLWVWGHNNYGQVGDGSREDRLSPVKVLEDIGGVLAAATEAEVSRQRFFVDGIETRIGAYNIGGANYLKARDVAAALRGTAKRFSVSFNPGTMTVEADSGREYVPIGGELSGVGAAGSVSPSTHGVTLDGARLYLRGYNIDGANYYMLRDFLKALDVSVAHDSASDSVTIDTSKGYAD